METRSERLAAHRRQRMEKRIQYYTECMQEYKMLKNPVLVGKSCCLGPPTLKEGEVVLPLPSRDEYLAFYTTFFDEATQGLDWDCDVCSLIFKESI